MVTTRYVPLVSRSCGRNGTLLDNLSSNCIVRAFFMRRFFTSRECTRFGTICRRQKIHKKFRIKRWATKYVFIWVNKLMSFTGKDCKITTWPASIISMAKRIFFATFLSSRNRFLINLHYFVIKIRQISCYSCISHPLAL